MADPRLRLKELASATVAEAIGDARSCGLVDFPRHMNVGDCAIWVGERAILRRLGVRVRVACDSTTYDRDRFRKRLGNAPVFIHGGGNFGGLYSGPQAFREHIFEEYSDRPVVQLPQTVNFVTDADRARLASLVSAHGRVTLMVRDHESAELASTLNARVLLSPDSALALGSLPRPVQPRRKFLYLARTDDEARSLDGVLGSERVDWLEVSDRRDQISNEWHKLELGATAGRLQGGGAWLPGLANLAYDRYAQWNVDRGSRLLASGSVVISDRLHAHVLCLLMGIPHVLIDDRYGKVSRFWRAWTSETPFARLAEDVSEVPRLANLLLDGG
jgi:exopolysaccharide biosynthesis predicted pyruvyltransferase EpsI